MANKSKLTNISFVPAHKFLELLTQDIKKKLLTKREKTGFIISSFEARQGDFVANEMEEGISRRGGCQ